MNTDIINALKNLNVIELHYEGKLRVVEPHRYGKTTAGNECLRAYQIGGYSSSGKLGWKMYDLEKISDIIISDQTFDGPREDYKHGDKNMPTIYAEL
ncbi:WYL domain-containing protein [Parafilimonas terrae]|uniref:WYL domain-containing protein n=1 Tax=Parafilimonas terrae TaxID=1465490 RepID=A0A1I5XGL3_9BACT|nr:hypothetical protein [Parafilimonas terrae]SFQ30817.1 hypothetical protein SAMN05444277_108155 [Parafilimonas terrae]